MCSRKEIQTKNELCYNTHSYLSFLPMNVKHVIYCTATPSQESKEKVREMERKEKRKAENEWARMHGDRKGRKGSMRIIKEDETKEWEKVEAVCDTHIRQKRVSRTYHKDKTEENKKWEERSRSIRYRTKGD